MSGAHDDVEDAAHPSGTHAAPGSSESPAGGRSGEEEIRDGRNPTQVRIDDETAERSSHVEEEEARAATSLEPPRLQTRSTEGLTVGGREKNPAAKPHDE